MVKILEALLTLNVPNKFYSFNFGFFFLADVVFHSEEINGNWVNISNDIASLFPKMQYCQFFLFLNLICGPKELFKYANVCRIKTIDRDKRRSSFICKWLCKEVIKHVFLPVIKNFNTLKNSLVTRN